MISGSNSLTTIALEALCPVIAIYTSILESQFNLIEQSMVKKLTELPLLLGLARHFWLAFLNPNLRNQLLMLKRLLFSIFFLFTSKCVHLVANYQDTQLMGWRLYAKRLLHLFIIPDFVLFEEVTISPKRQPFALGPAKIRRRK